MVILREDLNKPKKVPLRSLWAAVVAVVETAEGMVRQASDAAAIAFQNAMWTVCDLVQVTVEIPCHTRNGMFTSQGLANADLVLSGYCNAVHIDDTIDAVVAAGEQIPIGLRCTLLGCIAITTSVLSIPSSNDIRRAY